LTGKREQKDWDLFEKSNKQIQAQPLVAGSNNAQWTFPKIIPATHIISLNLMP